MGGAHTRHATGYPAASATTARSTRPGTHRGLLLIITAALALLLAALPVSPASAAPVATTTDLYPQWTPYAQGVRLDAHVGRADHVPPAGIVVFREGGTEIGRASLVPDNAEGLAMFVADAASGSHTYTASYLGDTDSAPSTGSTTNSVTQFDPNATVTGSIHIGSRSLVVGPTNDFAYVGYSEFTNWASGLFDAPAIAAFVDLPLSGDVTGSGPVTLAVRPMWTNLKGWVSPTGVVRLTPTAPRLQIDRITVGGETWGGGDCSIAIDPLELVGTAEPAGLTVAATVPAPTALDPTACDGRAGLVNALIDAPITFDLLLDETTPLPIGDQPTTTTISVDPSTPTPGNQITLIARVDTSGGLGAPGPVEFRDNGVLVGTREIYVSNGGIYRDSATSITFFVNEPGPHIFTADYLGLTTPDATLRLPSSASTLVTMPDAPPGRPTTGKFALPGQPAVALGPSTRLTGAAFDPATGTIGPGTFWLPPGQYEAVLGGTPIGINHQITQLAPVTGQVAADGTVTFPQASFRLAGRQYQYFGSWITVDCTFEPATMTLTGRADATGLHLTGHATIPPTTGTCGGFAGAANAMFTPGADFVFDVAGDFRRSDATPVQVVSWYPTVDQHNQTYLSAAVTPTDGTTPTGTITFRDGTTVLGTAPLDPTGHAHLPVTLDQAGPRTITADYTGDHHPGWGATTIDVTPAPVGYALDGQITLGAATLPIGPGSQLLLATNPGATPPASGDARGAVAAGLTHQTASLWFMPTTITTDLPGYGPVTAEVRLNQYRDLSPATIGTGGTIDGLNGMFVLHIRKVTTTTGTTTPLGCVNLLLVAFDGHLSFTDVDLTTTNAGTGRIPLGTCTGPAQALADQLTATPTATLHATL